MGSATERPEPWTWTVAPLATVVAPEGSPRPVLFCTLTAPALTVVAPVYVLAAVTARVPAPVFVKPPPPLITPAAVRVSAGFVTSNVLLTVTLSGNDMVLPPD